jgi:hypothetical protein
MNPELQLHKTQDIIHIWLYFVLIPLIIGIIAGSVVAKFRPHALKLTLMIITFVNFIVFAFALLIQQNQDKPQLAIIITIITTIIMNISAIISYKITTIMIEKK